MQFMEIVKGIEIIDLSIYLRKYNTLIISDTHIGYEESLNKSGIFIPRFQFKEIIQRLEGIFKQLKATTKNQLDKIIINGDIKHEFGTISEQEWRHTLQLLDFLSKHCKEIILIKGNHDKIIGPIAEKRNIKVVDQFTFDTILITHGHIVPNLRSYKTIIIGHEHPAISIHDTIRTETYKCYLKGTYKKKTLIVQPAFNLVTEGTDVSKEKLLSPFLKQSLKNFNVYVVAEDKVLDFGKIRGLIPRHIP
ncbi:MAG: metallophosphoesterase [Nanoarchaeota archaeon]|nr:metallophosphoesterase [Nanoarchaeota archaeon]MBU1704038.1 metallophosphoesterase [Nanoarchaeota archaeon]